MFIEEFIILNGTVHSAPHNCSKECTEGNKFRSSCDSVALPGRILKGLHYTKIERVKEKDDHAHWNTRKVSKMTPFQQQQTTNPKNG
jgi:hypothetical protein